MRCECVKCGEIRTITEFDWCTGNYPICSKCNVTMGAYE